MGRIISEPAVTSLADADVVYKDNPTTGSGKISGADLKAQFEIVARKGVANGYAPIAADGLLDPTIMRAALVPEEAADATALAALTVVAGDIGKRVVRLTDTGVYYLAVATGSGADKWMVYNSNPSATTSAQGVVELATPAEAVAGTDTTRAVTPAGLAAGVAAVANTRRPAQGLNFDGSSGVTTAPFVVGQTSFSVSLVVNWSALGALLGGAAHAFALDCDGRLLVMERGYAAVLITPSVIVAGKDYHIVYTRSMSGGVGVGTIYLDGILLTSGTDSTNYSGATTFLGSYASLAPATIIGKLWLQGIANRGLTAAEVLALHQTGLWPADCFPPQPAGAYTGTTFVGDGGLTVSGASATGFTAGGTATGNYSAISSNFALLSRAPGVRYRAKWTYTPGSGTTPYVAIGWEGNDRITSATPASAGVAEFTTLPDIYLPGPVKLLFGNNNGEAADYVVSDITFEVLGLKAAMDPDQPGAGNTWYDVSGNAANITLPATGVTWANPAKTHAPTTAYGVGTAYSLTNAAAAIDFGTTDPAIVLAEPGTYLIMGQVKLAATGATVVAETASIKVRRTNNTAADLSVVPVIDLPVMTTLTQTLGTHAIPPFVYTTTVANDAIALFANVSAALGAGTIDATAIGTSLVAVRLY